MDDNLLFATGYSSPQQPPGITMRCPACRVEGEFAGLGSGGDFEISHKRNEEQIVRRIGIRRCPRPDCHAIVFVVCDRAGAMVRCYPPELLDFNSSGIPSEIQETMREALACEANGCHTAAAMMIRKTLEVFCEERGATGANLKQRIEDLAAKETLTIPQKLLDAVDELRLLGNDAAHIKAHNYEKLGKPEVRAAIAFTQEILRATYQLDELVDQLMALKKPRDSKST